MSYIRQETDGSSKNKSKVNAADIVNGEWEIVLLRTANSTPVLFPSIHSTVILFTTGVNVGVTVYIILILDDTVNSEEQN